MGALSRISTMSALATLAALALIATPDSASAETLNNLRVHDHDWAHAKPHGPPLKWSPKLAEYSEKYVKSLKGDCKLALYRDKDKEVRAVFSFPNGVVKVKDDKDGQTLVAVAVLGNEDYSYGDGVKIMYDGGHKTDKYCDHGKSCEHHAPVDVHSLTHVGCAKVRCEKSKGASVICHFSGEKKPDKHPR